MFDVFTEEIEVNIKEGIANLYWFKNDLKKAWLRSGVQEEVVERLFSLRDEDNRRYSKRMLMDSLYEELRKLDYNRRLEISRNFVRIIIETENFIPQDPKHKIELAARVALRLQQIISEQNKTETRKVIRVNKSSIEIYNCELEKLRNQFDQISILKPQERGYRLEKLFIDLMKISNIPIVESFKILGEQIDGAIKYDGHHYLIELKWVEKKCAHNEIASLFMKVEGKMDARGIFISMNGYSSEILNSLPKGKGIKVILLDGQHFTNVIYGFYNFEALLNHAITEASLRGNIYCSHQM